MQSKCVHDMLDRCCHTDVRFQRAVSYVAETCEENQRRLVSLAVTFEDLHLVMGSVHRFNAVQKKCAIQMYFQK